MKYSVEQLDMFFKEAEIAAQDSDDLETKVGAIVELTIREKPMFLYSSNKFVRGCDRDSLPRVRPDKHLFIIHAEQNLIYSAIRSGESLDGKAVFCTLAPCQNCIRALWQAGVSEVYFRDMYKHHDPNMKDLKVTETKIGSYYYMKIENH